MKGFFVVLAYAAIILQLAVALLIANNPSLLDLYSAIEIKRGLAVYFATLIVSLLIVLIGDD